MAFDLGINNTLLDHPLRSHAVIQELEKNFALILINEHFDESLEIMRNLLCWTFEDMVYKPIHVQTYNSPPKISQHAEANLRNFLKMDIDIYNHFRALLHKKVQKLKDLGEFAVEELVRTRNIMLKKCHKCQKPNLKKALKQCKKKKLGVLLQGKGVHPCPCPPFSFCTLCSLMSVDAKLCKLAICYQKELYL
jgi:hypothetical protein